MHDSEHGSGERPGSFSRLLRNRLCDALRLSIAQVWTVWLHLRRFTECGTL